MGTQCEPEGHRLASCPGHRELDSGASAAPDAIPDRDEERPQEEAGHGQADGRRGPGQPHPQDVPAQLDTDWVDGWPLCPCHNQGDGSRNRQGEDAEANGHGGLAPDLSQGARPREAEAEATAKLVAAQTLSASGMVTVPGLATSMTVLTTSTQAAPQVEPASAATRSGINQSVARDWRRMRRWCRWSGRSRFRGHPARR